MSAKRGLVTLTALTVLGSAQAANWMPTNAATKDAVYTIDASSIRLEADGVVRAWFQAQHSKAQYTNAGQAYTNEKFIDRFFCKTSQVSFGPQYLFNNSGDLVYSDTSYDPPKEPVPESIAESLMNLTCTVALEMAKKK
jgi:hypothetical protein